VNLDFDMPRTDKKLIGGVAVIVKNGKHLLIKQSKHKPLSGQWRHPGGRFEPGESYAEGIKREIKEELDIEIEVKDQPFYTAKSNYYPGYFGFFEASWIRGDIKLDTREAEEFGWFDAAEIKNLPLMPPTEITYKKLLKTK